MVQRLASQPCTTYTIVRTRLFYHDYQSSVTLHLVVAIFREALFKENDYQSDICSTLTYVYIVTIWSPSSIIRQPPF